MRGAEKGLAGGRSLGKSGGGGGGGAAGGAGGGKATLGATGGDIDRAQTPRQVLDGFSVVSWIYQDIH